MSEEIRKWLRDLTPENLEKVILENREDIAKVEVVTWDEVELMNNYAPVEYIYKDVPKYPGDAS